MEIIFKVTLNDYFEKEVIAHIKQMARPILAFITEYQLR